MENEIYQLQHPRWQSRGQGRWQLVLLLLALLLSGGLHAQNLINNPGFEQGSIPFLETQIDYATDWGNGCAENWVGSSSTGNYNPGSPDLFDSRSTNCEIDIPANKWAINRNVRAGGYRYVGFSGGLNVLNNAGGYNRGESVLGTLNTALQADCNYNISLWASAIDGYGSPVTPCVVTSRPNSPNNQVQVVLRKTDCNGPEKVVFTTSGNLPKAWTNFSGTFSLTAAEAAIGFDKIEFRMALQPQPFATTIVFMDDVSLTPPDEATAGLTAPSQICLGDPLNVDGSSSTNESAHQWSITACDPNGVTTWDPNTTWIGPWISGPAGTADLAALSGFNFQGGQHYLVRVAVGNCATTWTADHQVVFVAPLPAIDAGPDVHICAGSSVVIGDVFPTNYLFNWTGGPVMSLNSNGTATVNPLQDTEYTLYAANSYGCSATDQVTVYVDRFIGRPQLTVTGGGDLCPAPFTITATHIEGANYLWSTGADTETITVNPNVATTYTVTISNACNSVTLSTTITPLTGLSGAFPPVNFANWLTCSLPVAFTHTGLNWGDTPAYNATGYQLLIYDRWGHIIYDESDTDLVNGFWNGEIEWDGTANISTNYSWWQQVWHGMVNSTAGQCVSVGVYTVQLRLDNCDNSEWVIWNDEVSYLGGRLHGGNGAEVAKTASPGTADLAVYPNPSTGLVNLVLDQPGEKTIRVHDLQGKIIFEDRVSENQTKMNLTDQTPGMYFITVECSGQTFKTKLILQ